MDFLLSSTAKAMGEHGIKRRSKTQQDSDYAEDLNILHENIGKMNELLDDLRVLGVRLGLKINVKSPRLGISEGEKVILGTHIIDQVDSFIYLGSIIGKDGGYS